MGSRFTPSQKGSWTKSRKCSVSPTVSSAASEEALVEWLCRLFPPHPRVVVGPGDDAAAVRLRGPLAVLTTDALVEGVHFRRGWMTPSVLGARAFAVSLSDVAAMGAVPCCALLSLGVPRQWPLARLRSLVRGFARAAERVRCAVVGGNVSAAPALVVDVTLVGEARRVVGRGGARVGDELYVTGTLGDAALGREILAGRGGPRGASAFVRRRFCRPEPRLRVGQRVAAAGLARAMIDLSDGLLRDLRHLCRSSGTGAIVDRVPLSAAARRLAGSAAVDYALRGGEDYELLFAAASGKGAVLGGLARRFRCRLTRIGHVVPSREGIVAFGARVTDPGGFDHFR